MVAPRGEHHHSNPMNCHQTGCDHQSGLIHRNAPRPSLMYDLPGCLVCTGHDENRPAIPACSPICRGFPPPRRPHAKPASSRPQLQETDCAGWFVLWGATKVCRTNKKSYPHRLQMLTTAASLAAG